MLTSVEHKSQIGACAAVSGDCKQRFVTNHTHKQQDFRLQCSSKLCLTLGHTLSVFRGVRGAALGKDREGVVELLCRLAGKPCAVIGPVELTTQVDATAWLSLKCSSHLLRAIFALNTGGTPCVVMAGGMVANAVRSPASRWSGEQDIDLFVVAGNDQDTKAVVDGIVERMRQHATVDSSCSVSMNALTLYVTCQTGQRLVVQIVLNGYPSVGAVLRSFDMSVCAFAYTGYSFLTTGLGAYYLDTGVGVLQKPMSYVDEGRHHKYHVVRGCTTMLPPGGSFAPRGLEYGSGGWTIATCRTLQSLDSPVIQELIGKALSRNRVARFGLFNCRGRRFEMEAWERSMPGGAAFLAALQVDDDLLQVQRDWLTGGQVAAADEEM